VRAASHAASAGLTARSSAHTNSRRAACAAATQALSRLEDVHSLTSQQLEKDSACCRTESRASGQAREAQEQAQGRLYRCAVRPTARLGRNWRNAGTGDSLAARAPPAARSTVPTVSFCLYFAPVARRMPGVNSSSSAWLNGQHRRCRLVKIILDGLDEPDNAMVPCARVCATASMCQSTRAVPTAET
jgi:hypothetical protein